MGSQQVTKSVARVHFSRKEGKREEKSGQIGKKEKDRVKVMF